MRWLSGSSGRSLTCCSLAFNRQGREHLVVGGTSMVMLGGTARDMLVSMEPGGVQFRG